MEFIPSQEWDEKATAKKFGRGRQEALASRPSHYYPEPTFGKTDEPFYEGAVRSIMEDVESALRPVFERIERSSVEAIANGVALCRESDVGYDIFREPGVTILRVLLKYPEIFYQTRRCLLVQVHLARLLRGFAAVMLDVDMKTSTPSICLWPPNLIAAPRRRFTDIPNEPIPLSQLLQNVCRNQPYSFIKELENLVVLAGDADKDVWAVAVGGETFDYERHLLRYSERTHLTLENVARYTDGPVGRLRFG
jgi:hypothetical protein